MTKLNKQLTSSERFWRYKESKHKPKRKKDILVKKLIFIGIYKNLRSLIWLINVFYFRRLFSVGISSKLINIFCVIKFFISGSSFKSLIDFSLVDTLYYLFRFQLNYVVSALFFTNLCYICSKVMDKTIVISNQFLFKNINWLEREVWEMFGLKFKLNFFLCRLLLDYNFMGYPLRRDFTLINCNQIIATYLRVGVATIGTTNIVQQYRICV